MSTNQEIQRGINFLRMMNRGQLMQDILADFPHETEKSINAAIKAARQHKDAANKPPKLIIPTPQVKVYKDLATGEMQVVESVTVELLRDIIVKFDHAEVSEFQTMLPVHITIKRKKS